MVKQITPKVFWVGKVDWELTHFHGDELSTQHGSSYNSYLIKDKKNVLIDTVWNPFDNEFLTQLQSVINPHDIDYIIVNHSESDHSGALPLLMKEIPNTPIYCTKKAETILRGLYHQNWNFVNVATGDKLEIGESTLTFIEMTMLHWPDSMLTYLNNDNIVFSNDAFGQHLASHNLYNDLTDQNTLMAEAMKYYANILNIYSPLITKKIQQILSLNLPINLICPSHGIIWRNNPMQIVNQYLQWANAYAENYITIVYDTMWQSTRKMAEAIANGINQITPNTTINLSNAAQTDKNDIITNIFRSKAFLIGSPTINYGVSYAIAGILEMIHGAKFKNKKATAFGSYGWSGDAVKQITDKLKESNIETIEPGLSLLWNPTQNDLNQCTEFGKKFAQLL